MLLHLCQTEVAPGPGESGRHFDRLLQQHFRVGVKFFPNAKLCPGAHRRYIIGVASQDLTVDLLRFGKFFFFLQLGCFGYILVVLAEFHKLGLQRLCFVHAAHIHEHLSEFHACLLSLGVEFQGLLKGFCRIGQIALRE